MLVADGVNGTVCNAQQYLQSLSTLDDPTPSITCLTNGQAIGLTLSTGAAFLSLLSVFSVFVWISCNVLWYRKHVPRRDWRLFDRPFDIYMAAILGFDIWEAMGGILNVRWAHNGIVATGPYCTAQGIIQQFGEVGVGLSILLLAVHTFVSALWRVGLKARRFAVCMVFLIFCFVTLWVSVGASIHKHYEVPTPFWCWISPHFAGERLGGEYLFLWLTLFISILLYIPLYYWSEGRLSVDENRWYKFHMHAPRHRVRSEYAQRRAARRMLFYPLGYTLVVLPLSVVRWSLYDHKKVPTAVVFLAVSTWNLSGTINVLLLLIVRPQLLLLTRPECKVNVPMCVGIETEEFVLTPKSLERPSIHSHNSETPLRPLKHSVLTLSSSLPPPSLYSQFP